MDVDLVIALKTQSDSLKSAYDLCIICQASSKSQFRITSEYGKQNVIGCVHGRRKF